MHIKKLILLLFLIPVLAQAQKTTGPNYTYIAQRYEWIAGMLKGLGLPAGDSAQFQTGQELRAGAIYYDSTGVDSGLYVWSGLAWRNYDPATLTASQGITKVGSDFQLGGTITSNRILSTHSGSMRINTNSPDAKYQFFATDTIHNPDLEGNIPFTNFLAQRNLRYPAYSSAYYRVGAQFNLNVEIADSARLNTFGGDFFAANKTTMELKKLAGYTGRSVYMGGDFSTIPESVPIHINDLTLQHSTSTTSNYRYAKGYWAGTKSHLLIGQADTLENWIGFHSAGFTQGTAHVGYTFDFLGGVLGSATEAQVKNPWFLYGFSTRAKSLIAGPTGFGDSTIEASALIDASSTTKGVIWPRMTTVEKDAIASPATGLIVFDTDLVQYNFWDGDSWEAMGGGTTPTLQQVFDVESRNSVLNNKDTISMTGATPKLFIKGQYTPLEVTSDSTIAATFRTTHPAAAMISLVKEATDSSTITTDFFTQKFSTGTPQNGMGTRFRWDLESSSFIRSAAELIVKWVDATDVSRTSDVSIVGVNNAAIDTFMNIQGGGIVRVNNNADTLATKAYARSVGGGGGSGTVNSGTQYRLGYYATTGTAISEAAAITASRALISDANGVPTHSATTATEIGYVNGLTSNAQTQIDGKATGSITQNWFDDDLTLNGVTTKINRADFFDDMLTTTSSVSGTSYMLELVSGTNADASIGNSTAVPDGSGWAVLSTGTTTTGIASLGSTSVAAAKNKIDTTKTYRFETRLQIETLSDDTEDFKSSVGMCAYTTQTTGANMIWFRYSDNVDSGNWNCFSSDGTTTESSSSGVAAVAGSAVILGFEYDNAAVRFYVNGSLVSTHTTRLPEHDAQSMFPVIAITKTLGTTARNIFFDYVKYRRL